MLLIICSRLLVNSRNPAVSFHPASVHKTVIGIVTWTPNKRVIIYDTPVHLKPCLLLKIMGYTIVSWNL